MNDSTENKWDYSTDLDYEKDSKIDVDNLHKEWVRQSNLAYEYKKHYNNIKNIYNKIHEKLKIKRSELIREANENPDKCCNKSKPTANDIEAYYRTHKHYKKLKEELIKTEYELNMAEIAKDEIVFTRKKALEELSELWKVEYYSIPDLPKTFGDTDPIAKTSNGMRRHKTKN